MKNLAVRLFEQANDVLVTLSLNPATKDCTTEPVLAFQVNDRVNAWVRIDEAKSSVQLALSVDGQIARPQTCIGHPRKTYVETVLVLDDGRGPKQKLTLEEPWRCDRKHREVSRLSMHRKLPRNIPVPD